MEHGILRSILIASLCLTLGSSAGCGSPAASPPTTNQTGSATSTEPTAATGPSTVFAVIGDYGMDDANEKAVADLVASWDPAFIITTGDNYYTPAGGTGTGRYDESTGAYYGPWLKDISTTGTRYPVGTAEVNSFFPSLGNHEYLSATPALDTYLTYFTLPGEGFTNSSGNERYYDFVNGPIHFFVLNSNTEEPDGTDSTSVQARWLKSQLAASTSRWNIVYDHHPPFSSDVKHGPYSYMEWPFSEWGADAVISGHAHSYERIERNGIVYFVNGLGGGDRYDFSAPVTGSAVRYRDDWGAQRVTATNTTLDFEFWSVAGSLVDSYHLPVAPPND
jgi:tartrate-resistant acid phosphatase type 5